MKDIENAQERTDAKLRYAALHLEELRLYPRRGSGDDFERSHQEAFLYQLIGARDAFLQELNLYYRCGLTSQQVRSASIEKCMRTQNRLYTELQTLRALETDATSWLNIAKEMRDHSTHRHSVPRVFHVGGENDGSITLQDPRNKAHVPGDQIDVFASWQVKMADLVKRLRASAVAKWESNNKIQRNR
ncbi:MAG: hypothetical protein Q8K00_12215 [Syntrophales bacterium]|nr:hypothetical protein [Syntrophales bacterium]